MPHAIEIALTALALALAVLYLVRRAWRFYRRLEDADSSPCTSCGCSRPFVAGFKRRRARRPKRDAARPDGGGGTAG